MNTFFLLLKIRIKYSEVFFILGEPIPVSNTWKYSTIGLFSSEIFSNLGMGVKEAEFLTNMANMGLAESSHKVYKTAINHIKKCEIKKGISLDLPFDLSKTLHYLNYLLIDCTVKSNTCEKYLSGVRMYHLTQGFDAPALRPAIVNLLLKGRENFEQIQEKLNKREKRIPVSVTVMKLLKRRIRKIQWSEPKKRLVWAVCCVCWNGSFRIHEVLSKKKGRI